MKRSTVLYALSGVTAIVAVTLVPANALATPGVVTVATGLDNPRGVAFAPNGTMYVAEAGTGGPGPCFTGPEGDTVCFGTSGAVSEVRNGIQRRVLTGLPSIANIGGANGIGPSDVSFQGTGSMYVTVGLGADPAERTQLPAAGQVTGWLLRAQPGQGDWQLVADIAGFEGQSNPDGGEPDSNPASVTATAGGQAVADAGGNSLQWVAANGSVSNLAVFPDRMAEAPPFLGLPPGTQIPMQSVPTSVVRGPDGAFYVGELTGFPFQPGAARVHRVVPGQAPEVVAEGFTNIIDLAFSADGTLYVLEIAQNGLLSGDPSGALIRVLPGGAKETVLSEGLITPGGLAIRGDAAYVSNCGTCPGAGTVLRIALN